MKVNLAILFEQDLQAGGGYQQALNAALLANSLPKEFIKVRCFTLNKKNIKILNNLDIKAEFLNLSFLIKLVIYLKTTPRYKFIGYFLNIFFNKSFLEKKLKPFDIDIIYFLSPSRLAADLNNLNYIYTVWDISHRDDPEFPEVRFDEEFEFREMKFKKILPKAHSIIVDSDFSKKNIAKKYLLDEKRLHVIPHEPSYFIKNHKYKFKEKKQYILDKNSYIFYCAQFWPHKNHVYIIDGINLLAKKYGIKLNIIFSGSDKGNLSYLKQYVKTNGLEERVKFLGFVSDNEMIDLYANALALVMPTYFGPTNIPPLEAFKLGIPVLYSDLDGLREQVGNAGLLLNLNDEVSLADNLYNLISDNNLRIKLINAGFRRLDEINSINRSEVLKDIIKDFYRKKKTFNMQFYK